ncbi:dihydrofolate reductase [Pullulanibacillus pueri]|uniref:Dihydrofolate reductase n=1 Tax=Pullulanibacillus pueri TaxID=1437324 RepID=A0A8J2ZVB2_9BACL|nr:dihydrofolate reductase family protein [Pullulanibacillus pueri]MBM7680897.1 dihydrofolate reductase [Pullulanibacillus pueri]GGH81250.1 dihydrofolate reductase [Pullulanibacillus pueri]
MNHKRKVVVYIATSLDGYIATESDGLEWLFAVEGEGDNGYLEFYETVDTILLGRRTYDWIMEHESGNFPYKNKNCFVFSRDENENTDDVIFIKEDIVAFTQTLKNQEGQNIWIAGGGDLLHHFLKAELVDELIMIVAPTLIGKGIPLFKERDNEIKLTLKGIRSFNQFAELHYLVKKEWT